MNKKDHINKYANNQTYALLSEVGNGTFKFKVLTRIIRDNIVAMTIIEYSTHGQFHHAPSDISNEMTTNKALRHAEILFIQCVCFYSSRLAIGWRNSANQ